MTRRALQEHRDISRAAGWNNPEMAVTDAGFRGTGSPQAHAKVVSPDPAVGPKPIFQ
jgi:hypothetical protein